MNDFHKMYVEDLRKRLVKYDTDPHHNQRITVQKCKYCFYVNSCIAGQAFTSYNCKECGAHNLHPNTGVPKYCLECAKKLSVCCHCGESMD